MIKYLEMRCPHCAARTSISSVPKQNYPTLETKHPHRCECCGEEYLFELILEPKIQTHKVNTSGAV